MSGSWRISDKKLDAVEGKHAHVIIETDKKVLSYVDPRRFGNIRFLNKKNFDLKISMLPIDISEHEFDEVHIKKIFDKYPNKILKSFLLDQKHFSGVGNYIASEICARAKLLPTRLTSTLTKADCLKIKKAMDIVVLGAIKTSGTTFSGGYVNAFGEKGAGVQHLVVFHQTICQMCKKTNTIKTVMSGRGTYHCPKCQG
jgi:formamidopyrimidine-DNA glycosylase